MANPALSHAGHLDQHSAGGKAYCLPGGAPNLGEDGGEDKGKLCQILKLKADGVFMVKKCWLKDQYKKYVGVGGGASRAGHGGSWVTGFSFLLLGPTSPSMDPWL